MDIRNKMHEIGRMQWMKNKMLEELRNTKKRFEDEKSREQEELSKIEEKMRLKSH